MHDYEGFEGVSLSEYSGIDNVVKYADFITEHGKLGGAVLANFNADIDEATKAFENYAGEYTRPPRIMLPYIVIMPSECPCLVVLMLPYALWSLMPFVARFIGK
uniref:Uncharacterized protein n=1 Tax=OCS116 cluster bacterium TaxID=2030921 RepID=A0A2A4Z7N1_9PROT